MIWGSIRVPDTGEMSVESLFRAISQIPMLILPSDTISSLFAFWRLI